MVNGFNLREGFQCFRVCFGLGVYKNIEDHPGFTGTRIYNVVDHGRKLIVFRHRVQGGKGFVGLLSSLDRVDDLPSPDIALRESPQIESCDDTKVVGAAFQRRPKVGVLSSVCIG